MKAFILSAILFICFSCSEKELTKEKTQVKTTEDKPKKLYYPKPFNRNIDHRLRSPNEPIPDLETRAVRAARWYALSYSFFLKSKFKDNKYKYHLYRKSQTDKMGYLRSVRFEITLIHDDGYKGLPLPETKEEFRKINSKNVPRYDLVVYKGAEGFYLDKEDAIESHRQMFMAIKKHSQVSEENENRQAE